MPTLLSCPPEEEGERAGVLVVEPPLALIHAQAVLLLLHNWCTLDNFEVKHKKKYLAQRNTCKLERQFVKELFTFGFLSNSSFC
jgi:hypothetical protein